MNNLKLLAGLLTAVVAGTGLQAHASTPVAMTLEEIFRVADDNGVQLRPFAASVEQAAREASVTRAGRLPEIDATLNISYLGDGFILSRSFGDYQRAPIPHLGNGLELTVTQPLYTGGALSAAIDIADMRATAARYAEDMQRDNIRFTLAGYYLDLYKCGNLRRVVERNIALASEMLDRMRDRYERGTVLLNDITRYELLLADFELQLTRLDNNLEILNNALTVTAGLPEGTVVLPDTTMPARELPVFNEDWWQQEAVAHSPSLNISRQNVSINRRSESVARAGRLPKVGLQAGWSIDGPILTEVPPINRNMSYWYVGVGISYNLSSLFKSGRDISRSRAATAVAEFRDEATAQELSLAVNRDYTRYMESYSEIEIRLKNLELAQRNYDVVSTRYESGMALVTDLLDAASALLATEQQLVNTRIDILYYYYKLLFTTGKI